MGLPGTTLYTVTDAAGRYRLAPVPAGEHRVRAAAIGYVPAAATVTLAPADSAIADFSLEPSPLELTPLDVVSTKVPHFGEAAASVAQVTEQDIARDRKSTRLNSSHPVLSRMPSSA